MLSRPWQKAWLVLAILMLFFPAIFILIELPLEAQILDQWASRMLWKTQEEIPEYRELGVWFIREQYPELTKRELIEKLESQFTTIDYSSIRRHFKHRLATLRTEQLKVVIEAISVYSTVMAALFLSFWTMARIFGKIRSLIFQRHS